MIDLSSLNERQRQAVLHGDGPLLVLAGAGSGKTRVITYRIAHLIDAERARPSEIAAVTFTNKAAAEMQRRITTLLGSAVHSRPLIATFHSLSLRVLRQYADRLGYTKSFAVYDSPDQLALIKRVQRKLEMDETAFPPRRLRNAISDAKGRLISPAEMEKTSTDFYGSRLARVYTEYQKTLRELDGMDFDDLIVNHVELLREHEDVREQLHERWKYLLIDEYQDTNHMQYVLVRELAGKGQNVTAVGDEDQSIYKFRGADLDNILNFERDFEGAAVIKLEQNYRSTGNILAAASGVVANNVKRKGKTLFTDAPDGDPVRVIAHSRDRDEAEYVISKVRELRAEIPLSEIAVLFRTNAQSRSFEEELRSANIPYVVVGGTKFYERAEIRDALAFARAAVRHQDSHSIERVINVPARGIGAATIDRLRNAAEERDGSLWDAIVEPPEDLSPRAKKSVAQFREIIEDLTKASEGTVPEFFEAVLERTGYRKLYVNSRDPQDDARIENLDELLGSTREYQEENPDASVTDYLDSISLIADVDEWDDKSSSLTLMTLHAAKGLEFRVVFLTGMEDGILPHVQSSDDVEEERRLCYVGMTRAKEQLYLTHAAERRVHGTFRQQEQSPFLLELPESCVEKSGSVARGYGSSGRGTSYPRRDRPQAEAASSIGSFFNAPVRFDASALETGKAKASTGAGDKLERGARVRHASFGDGVILQKEGSGDATRLTVYFDRVGRKKFVARFANLTRI